MLNDRVHEGSIELEHGMVRHFGPLHGQGYHPLLLAIGGGLQLALHDLGQVRGNIRTLLAALPPGEVGGVSTGHRLAGLIVLSGLVHEEDRADTLQSLPIDLVLLLPDHAGAVSESFLQNADTVVTAMTITPGTESRLVQRIGILFGGDLGRNVLEGPEAADVMRGVQSTAVAGGLQAETEPIGGGSGILTLRSVYLDERNAGTLTQNILGSPLRLGFGDIGSVFGNLAAQGADIGDSGADGEGLTDVFISRRVGEINEAIHDLSRGGQDATLLDTASRQGHQHSQRTGGLGLAALDAVDGILTIAGTHQLHIARRSIAHDIALHIATDQSRTLNLTLVGAGADAAVIGSRGNGSHRRRGYIAIGQVHRSGIVLHQRVQRTYRIRHDFYFSFRFYSPVRTMIREPILKRPLVRKYVMIQSKSRIRGVCNEKNIIVSIRIQDKFTL